MIDDLFRSSPVARGVTTIVDVSTQARAIEASETLAAVFRSSPVAHSIVDIERSVFHDVNVACERMFGYSRDEFVGHSGREIGIWPDEAEYQRFLAAVHAEESGRNYAGRRRRKCGELFDVRVFWERIELNGRQYRLYSLLDVTAELAGRRSTEQLSRFFRSSPAAHLICRLDDGRYVEVNDAYERMSGYRRDEVIGRTPLERGVWFEPGVRAGFAKRLREEGRIAAARIGTRRRDGSPIDVLFSAEPIDLDGVPHLLVSMSDVTAETRARATEERLAKFFLSSPSAHAISRLEDGRYAEVNDAYLRMYGFERDELVGRTSIELGIWPDSVDRARFADAVARTGRVDRFPAKARRKTGEVFDVLISAERIELDGVPHVLVSAEDVTAIVKGRDEQERRVRERTAELEAANRELEAFSYSVSHDMRAPIRAIAAFSGILLSDHGGELSTEVRRLLERIAGSAEHMGALIDALLELSRLMRRPLERECVDLSAVAARLLRETSGRFPERAVRMVVQPGLNAVADPVLLRSVLDNLIANAWKYTAKTSGASIEFGREGSEFFVRDNGIGFDMAYAGKLFKPFERLHSAAEFPGTGIGLATVDRILRRHGGQARAVGAHDRGATIYFTLPE